MPPREKQKLVELNESAAKAKPAKKDLIPTRVQTDQRGRLEIGETHQTENLIANVRLYQILETHDGIFLIGRFIVRVRIDQVGILVDNSGIRVNEHRVQLAVELLDAELEKVPMADVVVCRPLEKLSSSERHDKIEVRPRANVGLVAMIPYSSVVRREFPTNFLRVVRRGIVADDELEVLEGLIEDGLDGLGDVAGPIVDWQADADARTCPSSLRKFHTIE